MISPSNFLVESLGFSYRGSCHLQTVSFTSSFPICIPFISFTALIAVAKTFKTMLKSTGESGHPCLVPDFRGNAFNFSPLRIMFALGLSHIAFSMLRCSPSIPALWKVYHNEVQSHASQNGCYPKIYKQ